MAAVSAAADQGVPHTDGPGCCEPRPCKSQPFFRSRSCLALLLLLPLLQIKVCTVPAAVSPAPTKADTSAAAPPPQTNPTAPTTNGNKVTTTTQGPLTAGGAFAPNSNPKAPLGAAAVKTSGGGVVQELGPKRGAAYRLAMSGLLRVSGGRQNP